MLTAEYREKDKDARRRYRSDLTDVEWAIIAPMLAVYHSMTADLSERVSAVPRRKMRPGNK